jgi:hypothetical protein
MVSAITAAASLPIASAALGVLGFAGAVIIRIYLPRHENGPAT